MTATASESPSAAIPPGLVGLLQEWVPAQRWFAGKGQVLAGLQVESAADLGTRDGVRGVDLVIAVTGVGAEGVVRYQVPVTLHPAGTAEEAAVAHALIGETDDAVVCDGLADPVGAALLLSRLAAEEPAGGLTFARRAEVDVDLPGRVVGVEQSNTSVVYGDAAILKVFRRLAPGTNPDLEVTRALAEAGSAHVAEPLGWIEGPVAGTATTLALLQRFLRGATDGWRLATESVRDLFAEGDLHADEVGGDFAGESERLGRATAEVHAVLREALPTAVAGRSDSQATAALMVDRLERAAAEVPELVPYASGLRASYDAVAALDGPIPTQRVHGDYHLGQVLRTMEGWTLLDFEGEPARPLAERTTLQSPLRDVAGMLRSFDYAARSLLAEHPGETGLAYRASEWAERNRGAFCDGYAEASGSDPRAESVLLRAFELDKAVYEVVYEARSRPAWLPIPLGSVARLASPGAA